MRKSRRLAADARWHAWAGIFLLAVSLAAWVFAVVFYQHENGCGLAGCVFLAMLVMLPCHAHLGESRRLGKLALRERLRECGITLLAGQRDEDWRRPRDTSRDGILPRDGRR